METRVRSWSSIVMAKPISSLRFGQDPKGTNYLGPTGRRKLHAKKGEPKLRWHLNRLLSNRNALRLRQKLQTAEKRQQPQQ